jgi:tetratricopeptide (TPR) repeat protein
MPIMNRVALAASFVAASLLLAGCGGSDESTPAEPDAAEPQAPATTPGPPGSQPLPQVQELEAAVEQKPDDYRTRHLLAMALHRSGQRDAALQHFIKVAEQAPEIIYKIELGNAYASLDRMDDAEKAFQLALQDDPSNSTVLYHLGNLAQRRNAGDEAISLYRQAIQNDPQHMPSHFQLAESLRLAGQPREAYRSYEAVVGLEPKNPTDVRAFDGALFGLATLDLQHGATERAVEFLQVLVESVPNHPQAHLLLGQALGQLGRQEEAQAELAIHQQLTGASGGAPPGGASAP